MNRQYRRRMEKLQDKEFKIFLKKNKDFLDAIKDNGGYLQTVEKIKNLLKNNYGQQEQTLERGEETISKEEEGTETQGNSENTEQNEVGN
jgi:hypothetical protein